MQSESLEKLNLEIRQILVDILPNMGDELQLEIAQIIQQIHRINHLIYRYQNSWFSYFRQSATKEIELITWLGEIKSILLILKSTHSNLSMVQSLRLNLERNINQYQYSLGGYIFNFLLYLSYSKSTPLKIVSGLLLTTAIMMVTLKVSMDYLYKYDALNQHSQVQIYPFVSENHHFNNPVIKIQNSSLDKSVTPETQIKHSNRLLFHSLIYSASAGALGSIVSIFLRVTKFQNESYDDPLIPFFLGMFKPFIGLILGIFVCSLINSQTVIRTDFLIADDSSNLTGITTNAREHSFIFSIAFMIGFSERLASDLLKTANSEIEPDSRDSKSS